MNETDKPKRKTIRLKEYDYSQNGAYFVTICTEGKRQILSTIVGGGVLDAPEVQLSQCGQIIKEQIESIEGIYTHIHIPHYVIMPNHVHLIVFVNRSGHNTTKNDSTPANAVIPRLISTFKRLSNRRIGKNIWQRSYYDHIIRDEQDYLTKWNYIENNPAKWNRDPYFVD